MKTYIIVGGVAGGASAAARLRRRDEKARIIIFERGEYISFANCGLPYHIGGTIKNRKQLLVTTPEALKSRFNIDVRTQTEVIKILPDRKTVETKNPDTEETVSVSYDTLLLAPGAYPVIPPVEGSDLHGVFSLRNMNDMDRIIAFINKHNPKTAVVAGGGFIGLELAENLVELEMAVNIVQRGNQVMKHLDYEIASVIHDHMLAKGVGLFLGDAMAAIKKQKDGLEVVLKSNRSILCHMVLTGLGVRPETDLARDAGLKLGSHGGIAVNQYMQTSNPYIYAVGDAVEVKNIITGKDVLLPLAGPANRQGRLAADNICGDKKGFFGVQGTEIIKIFDLSVARTGLAEKDFKDSNIPVGSAVIHPLNHADYYPGASPMTMKLVFSRDRGDLLGAQIVGTSGVDKRIDVLATAIHGKMTVKDLTELELAYAPPYSSAKDPVNMLGFVSENILAGQVKSVYWNDVQELSKNHAVIDVRTPAEFASGAINTAQNFPLDELRSRLDSLPDKPLLVYCAAGLRGYVACRILKQNGFDRVVNLSGGYKTYRLATQKWMQ